MMRGLARTFVVAAVAAGCTPHTGVSSGSHGESRKPVADFQYSGVVVHQGELPPESMLNALCSELAGAIHPDRALVAKLRELTQVVTVAGTDPSLRNTALEEWSSLRDDLEQALALSSLNAYDDFASDEAAQEKDGGIEDRRE
jgi:hypothetical protein